MSGSIMAHCSSVKSEGYFLRRWSLCTMCAHSSTAGTCANYLTNLLFYPALFPDSLSVRRKDNAYSPHGATGIAVVKHGSIPESLTAASLNHAVSMRAHAPLPI